MTGTTWDCEKVVVEKQQLVRISSKSSTYVVVEAAEVVENQSYVVNSTAISSSKNSSRSSTRSSTITSTSSSKSIAYK